VNSTVFITHPVSFRNTFISFEVKVPLIGTVAPVVVVQVPTTE